MVRFKRANVGRFTVGGVSYTYIPWWRAIRWPPSATSSWARINADAGSPVTAHASGVFTRIRSAVEIPGPDGNGTPISANVTTNQPTNTAGALLLLTPTNTGLCLRQCRRHADHAGQSRHSGETINIIATGLGLVCKQAGLPTPSISN